MPVGKRSPEQEDEGPNVRPLEVDKVGDRKSAQPQRTAKLIPPQLCFSFGRPLYLSTTTWFLRRMEGGSKLPGLQGIGNAGNTCYMNAAIQALAHCPPFMLYCLDCEMFIRHLSGQGVATVFCSLMKRLWSTEKFDDYINPRPLARVMQNPMFMGIQQQDSQEFLRCLLDIMHEELKVEISAPVLNGQAAPEADTEKRAKGAAPTLGNGEQNKQQQQQQQQQQQPAPGGHNYALRSRGECSANEPVGSSSNRQPSAASKAGRRSTSTAQGSSSHVDESVFMHESPGARGDRLQMFLLRTAIVSDAQTSQPRHQRLSARHPFTAYELDLNNWSTHRVRPVHCQHGTCLLCSAKARYFRRSTPNVSISANDASQTAASALTASANEGGGSGRADGGGQPMDAEAVGRDAATDTATTGRRRSFSRQEPVGSVESLPDAIKNGTGSPTQAAEQDDETGVQNGGVLEEVEASAEGGVVNVPNAEAEGAAKEQRMDCGETENGHVSVTGDESGPSPVAEPVEEEENSELGLVLKVPPKGSTGGPPQQRPDSQSPATDGSRIPPMLRAMIDEALTDESSDDEEETGTGTRTKSCNSTSKEPAKQYRSIVTDIFGGVTQSSVSCNSCSQASKQFEPFLDLSISLPDSEQVQALMRSRGELAKNPASEQAVPEGSLKTNETSKEPAKETEQETAKEQSSGPVQPSDKPSFASRIWTVVKSALTSRALTLMDCLEIYFSPEELNGTNQYHCEECKTKVDGVRCVSVKKLPEIMCIHLKRFRHELQFSSKIKDPVSFPLQNLDMRRFLSQETEDGISTYELIAVVSHIGGVAGGHYVTYVRHFLSSNWYELDDINVQQVTEQHVATVEAYMLFYKKSSVEMSVERAHVMRQVAAADCTPGQEMCFVSRQWVHRFNTCSNPGPITNSDFICPHGGAGIYTTPEILQMVTFAPRPLWDSLVERYGGGPLATTLRVCSDCRRSYDALLRRRHLEYQKFILLNQPLQEDGQIIFLVDRNWFFQWRDCVRSDDPDMRAPGPMDNSQLLAQLRRYGRDLPKGLFPLELTWDAFFLLFSLYGGGPVIYAIG